MLRKRLFPNFIVVGAQKAGTSSIYNTLRHHPELLPPKTKETHFFDHDEKFNKGKRAYADYFATVNRLSSKKTFEITPSYFFHPKVPGRIKAMFPSVKIITVLRNPVRRAFSAWNMFHAFPNDPNFGEHYDPRSFSAAIEDEMAKRNNSYAYLARGYYAEQLSRYISEFSRDSVLVLNYADLSSDRLSTLNQICDFIGIDRFTGKENTFNSNSNKRAYSASLDPVLEEKLNDHFKPYMNDLSDLLGEKMELLSID